jgi:putative membrane protein
LQCSNQFINQIDAMFYYNYFWGMDFIWWFLWIILMVWIFAVPYDIPGQRNRIIGPLDALQRRFAAGEIGPDEYHERKKVIEMDFIKRS